MCVILVGVLKHPEDLELLLNDKVYRIPVENMPVRPFDGIAFYQPASWAGEPGRIQYYGLIDSDKIVSKESINIPGSIPEHERYYLFRFSSIIKLTRPVLNKSGTRVSFHYTDEDTLRQSGTLLELFDMPDIEMKVMNILDDMSIHYDREYYVPVENANYYRLDFAVISKDRKIDIECDGKASHSTPGQKEYDRKRDAALMADGWTVLRLKERMIVNNPNKCREAIANILK
ncbi:MAG: DUF559 domain-containing protein [bacterium]